MLPSVLSLFSSIYLNEILRELIKKVIKIEDFCLINFTTLCQVVVLWTGSLPPSSPNINTLQDASTTIGVVCQDRVQVLYRPLDHAVTMSSVQTSTPWGMFYMWRCMYIHVILCIHIHKYMYVYVYTWKTHLSHKPLTY